MQSYKVTIITKHRAFGSALASLHYSHSIVAGGLEEMS